MNELEELIAKLEEKMINGRYEEALKEIDKAIEEKEDAILWNIKGSILADLNEIERALECFNKALEIDSKNDFAIASKGVMLFKMNRIEEAEKSIDYAISLNPKNFTALYWKGVIEGKKGNIKSEAEFKGKAAFILFLQGGDADSFLLFKEVYEMDVDLPIRYECGVAYARMLKYVISFKDDNELRKKYNDIISNCLENMDKICESAKILLKYMVWGEIKEIDVSSEKDLVFKVLAGGEKWQRK